LQVQGLQRQAPFVQVQAAAAFFSIVFSMVVFPFGEALIRAR